MNRKDEYAKHLANGTPYDQMIRDAADANGVDYNYLHKKIFNESSFNPTAKSPTGPRGLGQFTAATGRAYGLVSDADFNDPLKSINASAKHTRDLLGTYKGDYLKAALAYNQGNGRLGAPQLAALDRGDFSQISPEGKKYMANLLDVAGNSPSRKWFEQPGAPKLNGDFEDFTDGIAKAPKVQRVEAQDRKGFDLSEGEAPVVKKSFQEMEYAQNGPKDDSWFKDILPATEASIDNSWGGMKLRDLFRHEEHDPLADYSPIQDQWDDADYEAIRDAGIPPSMFSFLMDRTHGVKAELPNAIKVAKENLANEKIINDSGIGSQLVGGIATAPLDPVSYLPVPGSASATFAARVAKQAAFTSGLSVGSEAIRADVTGLEGHYASAAVGGAVLGGAFGAIFDKALRAAPKAPARPEMADADLESILARHGESSEKNSFLEFAEGDAPHARSEHPDSIEAILARHGESSEANEFYGVTERLKARESARLSGQDDPTRLPWNTDDVPQSHNGVDFVDVPGEPGAVRLADGSILSRHNPVNPKTLRMVEQLQPGRSARGFNLGAITEIGYTLNRTEDESIRAIGGQLFRSTVQTEGGSNGKFGATASDIIDRAVGEDRLNYSKLHDLTKKVLRDDPRYASKPGVLAKRELAGRRVAEAIEDLSKGKAAKLSPEERELMDLVNSHFQRKEDMLNNPAQFGNYKAKPVLESSRHSGSYFPNIYDDAAKALHIRRFGGEDGLQEAIKTGWLASLSRPATKARVTKMVKEAIEKDGKVATPEAIEKAIEKLAHDKAYGISHTADFNRSSMIDDGLDSLVGAENNNFLEARNPFDSDMEIPLSDGSMFSVNDLRSFDIGKIMTSYDRRINGDVGIMGSMGISTQELKDKVLAIKTKAGNTKDVAALESAVKLLTGRARRDPDSTFGTALRALNDLSFLTKSAYMGAQNITEVAGMVTNGHLSMLFHGVPILREMTTWGSKIKPAQLKEMHGLIFGRELDDSIRPRRQDIIDRLRSNGASELGAKVVGNLKFATGEAVAHSPFTRMLTESSNYIVEAGRQGALMDMIKAAQGGKAKVFTPDRLRQLSITKEQFQGIKDAINQHIVPDGDGFKIKDKAALRSDPRTMDIWRLGDKVADETILRPHKLSSQDTKALGAGWAMALQFKKFVLRSLNSRFIRGLYNVSKSDDRASAGLDYAIQNTFAIGAAVSFYTAQRYVQAQGMAEEQRKEFLKNAFSPEMLSWAAASRSNIIGAPIGAVNFLAAPLGYDPAAAVRTSILPRGPKHEKKDRPVRYSPLRSDGITTPLSGLLEQVPSAGILGSIYQVGANTSGILGGSPRNDQIQGYKTGLYNGLRGLVPNDPLSQRALTALMQSQGMEYRPR